MKGRAGTKGRSGPDGRKVGSYMVCAGVGGGGGVGGGTVLTLPFEIDLRRNELSKCELPI